MKTIIKGKLKCKKKTPGVLYLSFLFITFDWSLNRKKGEREFF